MLKIVTHIQPTRIITGEIITTIVIETTKVVIIVDDLDILLGIVGKEIIKGTKTIMEIIGTIRIIDLIQGSLVIVVTKRDIFPGIAIIHLGDLAHTAINSDIGDMYVQLRM